MLGLAVGEALIGVTALAGPSDVGATGRLGSVATGACCLDGGGSGLPSFCVVGVGEFCRPAGVTTMVPATVGVARSATPSGNTSGVGPSSRFSGAMVGCS